jgi:hypothetical protein
MQQSEFKLRDFVWAKVDGYPWWPAFILSTNSKKLEVMFFDDFTRAYLPESKIKDFFCEEMEALKGKTIYSKAMAQIRRILNKESTIEEEKEKVENEENLVDQPKY